MIARWLKRSFVLIGDGGFACVRLGHACIKNKVTLISRLRCDAALYEFAPSPIPGQLGRHREKGDRVISLKQLAIARSTPCLMALFSLTCLFAIEMLKTKTLPILSTAWYNKKSEATFSDILAFVRRSIWAEKYFNDSTFEDDYRIIKRDQWETLLDQLSRAA